MLAQRNYPDDLTQWSDIERELLDELAKHMSLISWEGLTDEKMKIVSDIVQEADVVALINLSERYPAIDKLCTQPIFNAHWNRLLKACGNNPDNELRDESRKIHEFLPLKTLPSFQLLKSIYIYGLYRKSAAKEELLLSAELGNFNAINACCHEQLEAFDGVAENARKIIQLAQKAADIHWTPGYILLANVYAALAKRSVTQNKKMYIGLALGALCIAEKLESASANMINNAYHGKSIIEAAENQFCSWQDARQKLMQLTDQPFDVQEVNAIFKRAYEIASKILNPTTLILSRKTADSSPGLSPWRGH